MTADEFLAAFEAAVIPRSEWTHAAHVHMAWLYLMRFSPAEAMERVRCGIQKLNAVIGVAGGYHETITVAFVRVISARLLHAEPYASFRDRNPDLFDRSLSAILRHYTRERLFSGEARAAFVEPDLASLPTLGPVSLSGRMNSLAAD